MNRRTRWWTIQSIVKKQYKKFSLCRCDTKTYRSFRCANYNVIKQNDVPIFNALKIDTWRSGSVWAIYNNFEFDSETISHAIWFRLNGTNLTVGEEENGVGGEAGHCDLKSKTIFVNHKFVEIQFRLLRSLVSHNHMRVTVCWSLPLVEHSRC